MSSLLLSFGNTNELVSGGHIASLYSKKESFVGIATSLIKSGIDSQEKCLVFVEKSLQEQVEKSVEELLLKKREDEIESPVTTEDVLYFTDKSHFFSDEKGFDLKKLFSLFSDHTENSNSEVFKRSRIILQVDWVFDAENGLDDIFLYHSELASFLEKDFDKFILIDCYDSCFFSGTELLKSVSCYDGIIIENEPCPLYFTNSRELALTDVLTGLYNEKYLQARIKEEIFRAKRYRGSCSLIAIRLDKVEEVKSKCGKKKIDQLFVDFADILRGNLRKVDLIAFYNRDCFAILMPETSKKRSFMIAERIKKVFEEKLSVSEFYKGLELFLKVGISNFPIDTRKAEELTIFAAEALEKAMKDGGHQICAIERPNELFPPLD